MDDTERSAGAMLARGSDERSGAFDIRTLVALLMLVLLMADVLTRQIGLLTESASERSGKATTTFFKIQMGDFRAEVQWGNTGKQE